MRASVLSVRPGTVRHFSDKSISAELVPPWPGVSYGNSESAPQLCLCVQPSLHAKLENCWIKVELGPSPNFPQLEGNLDPYPNTGTWLCF